MRVLLSQCPSVHCILFKYIWEARGQESACQVRDVGSIPGSATSGEGNGNPPQYSCLGNPMDRGAWRAAVHGVAESQTRLRA